MSDISKLVTYSCESDHDCSSKVTLTGNQFLFNYPCDSQYECHPYRVTFSSGVYHFDLWGAQGGDGRYWQVQTTQPDSGGKGAHVSGRLRIKSFSSFYFYIGGKGEDQTSTTNTAVTRGGFNGGGKGAFDNYDENFPESSAGGGGATDIRLIPESFGDIESLKSRIAVASGGGGAVSDNSY